jgi:hypothetical protein
MKNLYLVLAIVGTVAPYFFFLQHFAAEGFAPAALLAGAFANGAAGGFTADVIVASIAFWVYLLSRRVERAWIYMLLNVTVGLSCALPLYLYLTARGAPATTRAATA